FLPHWGVLAASQQPVEGEVVFFPFPANRGQVWVSGSGEEVRGSK
ncbi:unnamed protein product, partial [Gulo gulo]